MKDPVFIVGCPRSGTTLLSVIIDRNSQIAITPETGFYHEIAPKLIGGQGFNLKRILRDWSRLPELGLDADQVVNACGDMPTPGRLLGTLLSIYRDNHQKMRCGEKTPQHLWCVPRIIADFPEAKIICLIRDGREVALSLRSMPWWEKTLTDAANLWVEAAQLATTFLAKYPAQFRTLRFEQLVADPAGITAGVMQFLGLEFEGQQLTPNASRVVLARSLQWKGMALGPVDSLRAEYRRREANIDEVRYLNDVQRHLLLQLGYC